MCAQSDDINQSQLAADQTPVIPTPSSPVDNPLIYLTQPSGERVACYHIVDSVSDVVNVKEH